MFLTKNRRFRRFGFGAIAALALGVAGLASIPAQAHEFGHRAPMAAHHAAFFPRIFYGFGHHPHHWDHGDHRWR